MLFNSRSSARVSLGALALLAAATTAHAQAIQTVTVDFFPEEPQTNHISQLRFIGAQEGTIVSTRLIATFDTAVGFNAAELQMVLVAPVPDSPGFGGIFVTGEDLGWVGTGSFTTTTTFNDLNGEIAGGLWGFELQSINDPPAYSGSFSADTRWEIDIIPVCHADFNEDGSVSVQDIFDFLAAYFTNDPTADINNSEDVTVQDIFDFLSLYFAGCA